MKWISVKDKEPPKSPILVYSSVCKNMHVGYYDYGCHNHTEGCYKDGGHFIGDALEFEYWLPLPEPPKE